MDSDHLAVWFNSSWPVLTAVVSYSRPIQSWCKIPFWLASSHYFSVLIQNWCLPWCYCNVRFFFKSYSKFEIKCVYGCIVFLPWCFIHLLFKVVVKCSTGCLQPSCDVSLFNFYKIDVKYLSGCLGSNNYAKCSLGDLVFLMVAHSYPIQNWCKMLFWLPRLLL